MTIEEIEEFEKKRDALWQEEAEWWLVRREILGRQTDLRSKFIFATGIANNIAIEQQIADWRWRQSKGLPK